MLKLSPIVWFLQLTVRYLFHEHCMILSYLPFQSVSWTITVIHSIDYVLFYDTSNFVWKVSLFLESRYQKKVELTLRISFLSAKLTDIEGNPPKSTPKLNNTISIEILNAFYCFYPTSLLFKLKEFQKQTYFVCHW